MGIDLVARAKEPLEEWEITVFLEERFGENNLVNTVFVKDLLSLGCIRGYAIQERWLRERVELWYIASEGHGNDPTYTEGGADALEHAADDIKKVLEEIDG